MSSDKAGLMVVSNRLPVQRVGSTWRASAGGLVTALRPIVAGRRTTWVGWDGGSRDLPESLPGTDARLEPVALSRDTARGYYDGFANATLWPLFHNLVGTPEYDNRWWACYERANDAMAAATAKITVDPASDLVWVHDYHLMLMPQMLREAGLTRIRFFLHIPWPAPELFSRLPWRPELLPDGALVLSEFTGAATELREAFLCNPFDIEATSRVMEDVVASDARDRHRRIRKMARRVRRADIHRWAAAELHTT